MLQNKKVLIRWNFYFSLQELSLKNCNNFYFRNFFIVALLIATIFERELLFGMPSHTAILARLRILQNYAESNLDDIFISQ